MKHHLALCFLTLSLCACNSGGGDSAGANTGKPLTAGDEKTASEIVVEPWPMRAGEPARFSVSGAATGASYRWHVGNRLLAGSSNSAQATLSLSENQAAISVEITSPDGSRVTRSLPANVIYPVGVGFVAGGMASDYVDGDVISARFTDPRGLAVDANGDIYVADAGTIRKISASIVSTFAGHNGDLRIVDGERAIARLRDPRHLAFDSDGNLLVTEIDTLRRIGRDGQVSTTAGQPAYGVVSASQPVVDGDRQQARFAALAGVCVGNGQTYVSDYPTTGNPLLRAVDASGNVATLLANWLPQATLGTAAAPRLRYRPLDGISIGLNVKAHIDSFDWIDQQASLPLACGASGENYLFDEANYVIRKIGGDRQVSVFAGQFGVRGDLNGSRSAAQLDYVADMAVAADGSLYIAERDKMRIRRVRQDGSIEALVGGVAGVPVSSASLNSPIGNPKSVRIDTTGKVLYFISGNAVMYASLP